MTETPTLDEQIAEAGECVKDHRLTIAIATYHVDKRRIAAAKVRLSRMEAILATLQDVKDMQNGDYET